MYLTSQQSNTNPAPRRSAGLLAALLVGAALSAASAQNIYRTGFEKPAFTAGAPVAGRDGWIAPPPLSPDAAVVTKDRPRIGGQTVRVAGADLVHQDFINEATGGYFDAIGSYRHAVNFDATDSRIVRVSAYVFVDGRKTQGKNLFSASLAARATLANGDTAGVGELAISSDGHAYGYSGNEDVPTFQTSRRIELGKWHHLAVIVDFEARKYAFLVDHEFLGAFDFDPNNVDETGAPVDYTNVLARGSLITYAAPDAGTFAKANYSARFDQFCIKAKAKGKHRN